MKKLCIINVLALVLFFVGCGNDKSLSPQQDPLDMTDPSVQAELIALEVLTESSWPADANANMPSGDKLAPQKPMYGSISNFQRETIKGNIAHYSFQVPVGPGQHDIIGIHRVVKETQPFRPVKTDKSIFFQHGDFAAFEAVYLPGTILTTKAEDFGIAAFLAGNDVDVWGIDQAWTLVLSGTSNLSFMMDWGLQRQVDDLNIALLIARFARLLSGNGLNKMLLSGYSSGSATGYAFLNAETQKPPGLRQVDGYVSVDMAIKTDVPGFAQIWADRSTTLLALRATGVAQDDDVFLLAGTLASSDPNGTSPIAPALGPATLDKPADGPIPGNSSYFRRRSASVPLLHWCLESDDKSSRGSRLYYNR